MPRPAGLFDLFDNLDDINPQAVAIRLKPVPEVFQVENYLANKILYPQTVPQTPYEMLLDLAIFAEALKKTGGNPFLNVIFRKILIPAKFLDFVPDPAVLTYVFLDAFFLKQETQKDFSGDLWTVVLTGDTDEIAGSVILPEIEDGGIMNLTVQGKIYKIRQGRVANIPCGRERCRIAYKVQKGIFLGKSESAVEVSGGKLGLIVAGRKR